MFVRRSINQSLRRGLVVASFVLAIFATFSAVQLLAADAGNTAVTTLASADSDGIYSGTITAENRDLSLNQPLAPSGVASYTIYMPQLFKALVISATRPNSANQWTISWEAVPSATGYVIQESQDSSFATGVNEINAGNVTSYQITQSFSSNNVYYYRVKPTYDDFDGQWSDSVMVIGGYRDDFSCDSSGWVPTRRMTFLEETVVYYGSGSEAGNLIIIVADRWDWLIGSPLKPAPKPPYAIEFRARVHDASNLVSGGAVFGGDWNGQACPEIGNVYQTTNCFNHFYNFNMIFY